MKFRTFSTQLDYQNELYRSLLIWKKMNVSVGIKTGKRRVIEHVLTSLMNGIK